MAGQDVLSSRPTLLMALALEGSSPARREELLHLLRTASDNAESVLGRVRRLYFAAKVFEKAEQLINKFRAKAEALADDVEPVEFRELLYYLVDTVLEKPELPRPEVVQVLELGR
jgi:geranylgeranyl pyrophosphate synthase